MASLLGIDTGGTFTDAALVSSGADGEAVIATAKAPTTHHDLTIGIAEAVASVSAQISSEEPIDLVSVSTTLATNALVEGHGDPAGVLAFGFSRSQLARAGIVDAVDDSMIVDLGGGHDAHGTELAPFPARQVKAAVAKMADRVSAFAVTALFSVRNPAHELAAAELIRELTGHPVTSSHELSARLDGPRRALTAALNARLLGTIRRLDVSVRSVLAEAGIDAPLMVVRGDGSLVSAEFAATRPIETILSGPAASVVGAMHLSGLDDAVVVDMGGTTSDVAFVTDRRPRIADRGAVVGGHSTMVEAVEMATMGLGGDSEVCIDASDRRGPVLVGPARALPVGRLVRSHPEVAAMLEKQLEAGVGVASHGRFLVATGLAGVGLGDRERQVLERLAGGPLAENSAAPSALEARAAMRLRARGLVRVATMTPTDAQAIIGSVPGIDRDASKMVAEALARKPTTTGAPVAASAETLARNVVELVVRSSARFALRTALAHDGIAVGDDDPLVASVLDRSNAAAPPSTSVKSVTSVDIGLAMPLIAIGAPAGAWFPAVGAMISTPVVVPAFSEVANAVGAVVGQVRVRRSCTITQPTRGQYRVHLDDQPTFGSVDNARACARERLTEVARSEALAAGAANPESTERWQAKTAVVNDDELFVEGTLTIEVAGRPRFHQS